MQQAKFHFPPFPSCFAACSPFSPLTPPNLRLGWLLHSAEVEEKGQAKCALLMWEAMLISAAGESQKKGWGNGWGGYFFQRRVDEICSRR